MRLKTTPKNERKKIDCKWYDKRGGCHEPNQSPRGESGAIFHRKRKYCNPYICGSFKKKRVAKRK